MEVKKVVFLTTSPIPILALPAFRGVCCRLAGVASIDKPMRMNRLYTVVAIVAALSAPVAPAAAPRVSGGALGERRERLSKIRQTIAQRMILAEVATDGTEEFGLVVPVVGVLRPVVVPAHRRERTVSPSEVPWCL